MITETAAPSVHKVHPAVVMARQAVSDVESLSSYIDQFGTPMSFGANTEIYGEGEPAEYLYKVVGGAVRMCRILADGRRQIGSFYLPGEVFGLESGDDHTFSAEAIANSRILVVRRSALLALAGRDRAIANELWTTTCRELRMAQNHILMLIKTAKERVVAFLLEMAERASSSGQIELPMSRQDIADYLGLTIETVSRTLTELARTAAIELPATRCVVLRNRAALARLEG
ncbi:helix-turn-helix domain-containing protein [Rhodoplanes sp. Z2-YC6860]|uniref:helix-turn-helix domain-containing protein n=1 Tax=Rhodoplanes sp. Z2-YC6860 TaxID=674703 RepID=UPI00078EACAF|nr:helix-turn-helix domain-containing protein [Rhodoplanes sp. Z2-YC6860]AMN45008.1 nitrogen fixation regulation protein FixK [Rhodoplanes sp. Z2-YC6860]